MPNTSLARALSSEARWNILNLLMARPLSESQIRKALGASARSVGDNLAELVSARLLEVLHEKLPSGREAVVYRIAPSAQMVGFPPRSYEGLSEALIRGLISSLGQRNARYVIRDIGLKLGEQMGRSLLTDTDSTTLTMKEYSELFVKRLLAAQNAYPQILSQKRSGAGL